MNTTIQASLFLMAAGMGTVFLSLGVFFTVIVLLEKIFRSREKAGQ